MRSQCSRLDEQDVKLDVEEATVKECRFDGAAELIQIVLLGKIRRRPGTDES